LLIFCQEFPFYAFWSSATTIYPPLAMLRRAIQDTTLNELADLLNCSRRHMRTLLNTMQQQGWLNWEAEAGRGKRSRLTFLYTGLALQQQRAEDLLEQDRIDQLVQLVGDKAAVRQMLVSHLGRSFRQGGIFCGCSTIVR
jgi:MarR-like DNA-binding transcriptional regulator SgrR of sgrS sRNA